MVAPAKKSLTSIGRMAELLQAAPEQIRAITAAMEIPAALELNDVPYYAPDQIDRIMRRLRERSAATTIRPAGQPHKPENLLR